MKFFCWLVFMKFFISNFHKTIFQIAIENNNLDIIKLLINRDDIDVNTKFISNIKYY